MTQKERFIDRKRLFDDGRCPFCGEPSPFRRRNTRNEGDNKLWVMKCPLCQSTFRVHVKTELSFATLATGTGMIGVINTLRDEKKNDFLALIVLFGCSWWLGRQQDKTDTAQLINALQDKMSVSIDKYGDKVSQISQIRTDKPQTFLTK